MLPMLLNRASEEWIVLVTTPNRQTRVNQVEDKARVLFGSALCHAGTDVLQI